MVNGFYARYLAEGYLAGIIEDLKAVESGELKFTKKEVVALRKELEVVFKKLYWLN